MNLIRLVVVEMSKTDFQVDGCGGYLVFLIDKSLANFDPEVNLLLWIKFRLKPVWGEMLKIDFRDGGCGGHFGISIGSA